MVLYVLAAAIYTLILVYTGIRILLDTYSTSKTLAYLLLVIFLPVAGILVYFAFGQNYRHERSDIKGYQAQRTLDEAIQKNCPDHTGELLEQHAQSLSQYTDLITFVHAIGQEHLSENRFNILINGEEKFPAVLSALSSARETIHMEYYSWENDVRGNQIKDMLLKKHREGVKVRVLYDDYASRKIKSNIVRELRNAGIEVYPKIRVRFNHFANRINHRDHRKVIIIDSILAFVGGINISDRYDNSVDTGLYWRDTHLKVEGPLASSLQRHFIVSWNSCQADDISFEDKLFPKKPLPVSDGIEGLGQIVAGGPIYPLATIMLTYLRLFSLARKSLYVTNPYFIPNESITDALKQAALSGVDVRLILPEKPDSAIVGAASRFYFSDLLEAGVRIFLYSKGFVHAKTVVADSVASIVGTANLDIRSFDLNFEIMATIFSPGFARRMEAMFADDLKNCREITISDWEHTRITTRLKYALARLISSFL